MKEIKQGLFGGSAYYPEQGIIVDKIIAAREKSFSAVYRQGVRSGLKAEDAPALRTLQQIVNAVTLSRESCGLPLQPRITSPEVVIVGEGVSFRRGYVDGLKRFIAEHKIDPASLGIWATPDVLTRDDALKGYLRGLRRESPNVMREYSVRESTNERIDPKENWIPASLQLIRIQAMLTREGYKLGFAVGVAKDFDIVLVALEIPTDNLSYEAFMAGLRADPKALPIKQKPYGDENKNSLESQFRAYKVIDDVAYRAGLRTYVVTHSRNC